MKIFRNSSQILKMMSGVHGVLRNTRRHHSYEQLIDVHPQVKRSLQRGLPVVALESTIITHGMPYPQNLVTAQEVEELVRQKGATPATIAIVDGRIKVGLTDADLVNLATKKQRDVIKCSRRDLPYVVANKQSGGTTVAATMIIAHMVGLRIFATGGVGGVHREGHITLDVSADLVELGRTPVAVICSGVKSILDIPRTLEYLETQGVCVATYGSEDGCFPDFYTRDSGHKVPYNLAGPKEAANLINMLHNLEFQSGILIGVPIPEAFAADKQLIDSAIEEAYKEAEEKNVKGKQVTPFLLEAIAKITKGSSLQANIALIKNNASVAAQIANEMCKDTKLGAKPGSVPVIVGASIMDLSLKMLDDMPKTLDGATYHTIAKQSAGGVGRNLAEGIFKLHGDVNFISIVGDDSMGKSLLQLIPEPLREGVLIDTQIATSLCSVIFDKIGDCKLILGNMEIHERITPERVQQQEYLLRSAPIIIIDGNLPVPTMEYILGVARYHKRPVFFEPTDMRIAGKPFSLPRSLTKEIKIISPNIYELKTIVEAVTKKPVQWNANVTDETTESLLEKTKELVLQVQHEFDCILVTLGHHGMLLSLHGYEQNKPLFISETGDYIAPSTDGSCSLRFYAAAKVPNVTNVSGAGDSFSSGFITGLLRGYNIERSVALGFLAAERALQTSSAVPALYFKDNNEQLNEVNKISANLKKVDIMRVEEASNIVKGSN